MYLPISLRWSGKILNDNIEKLQQQINSLDPESEKTAF